MQFTVVAVTRVPDVTSTRQLFEVADLDDESVARVLFHQRRQQTGSSEVLRWDQRAIAGITLLEHAVDEVRIESLTEDEHDESAMLHAFYQATLRHTQLITWGGTGEILPLLHFRTLMHEISYPSYWQAVREGREFHRDLRSCLTPEAEVADSPGLDETARRLGFPGLLHHTEDAAAAAWLQGDFSLARAYSELRAINTYLVALRLLAVTGEVDNRDAIRTLNQLREALATQGLTYQAEFLTAWGVT